MALLVSPVPYAQTEVLRGIAKVLVLHSEHSRQRLYERLEYLDAVKTMDVVLTYCTEDFGNPEFGLAWFRREQDNGEHPQILGLKPAMVGGLVFHSFNDTWGVHT